MRQICNVLQHISAVTLKRLVLSSLQATAALELTAVDDAEPEAREEFVVKLSAPDNGATLGSLTTATVVVLQSDAPFGLFQIFPSGTR